MPSFCFFSTNTETRKKRKFFIRKAHQQDSRKINKLRKLLVS